MTMAGVVGGYFERFNNTNLNFKTGLLVYPMAKLSVNKVTLWLGVRHVFNYLFDGPVPFLNTIVRRM